MEVHHCNFLEGKYLSGFMSVSNIKLGTINNLLSLGLFRRNTAVWLLA